MCEITKTDKNGFEIETCTRCGGSGQYSYCTMYGTRCFRCSGRGQTFTKRGAAAMDFFWDSLAVPVEEIKPGDFVKFTRSHKWAKVISVGPSENSKYQDTETGEYRAHLRIETADCNYCTFYGGTMIRGAAGNNTEAINKAIEYQKTLGKSGKPKAERKSRKKVAE